MTCRPGPRLDAELLLEALPDAAVILDGAGAPVAWNRRGARLWDLPAPPGTGLAALVRDRLALPAALAGPLLDDPAAPDAPRSTIVERRDGGRLEWRSMALAPGTDGRPRQLCLFRELSRDSAPALDEEARIRAQFLEAAEAVEDAIILCDRHQRIVHWNAAYRAAFPLLAGRLRRGADAAELIEAGIAAGYIRRSEALPPRPGAPDRELQLADGRLLRVIERGTADGGRIVIYRDITEHRRREAALAAATELAEAQRKRVVDAIEAMAEGVSIYGADRRLILTNSAVRALYPAIADRLVPGAPAIDILRLFQASGYSDPSLPSPEARIEQLFDPAAVPPAREFQILDGRWLRSEIRPTAEGGRIIIAADITERRQRAAALEAAEQAATAARGQLYDAIEAMSEGVAIYGPDRRLIMSNSERRRLYPAASRAHEPGATALEAFRDLVRHGYMSPLMPDAARIVEQLFSAEMSNLENDVQLTDGRWMHVVRRRTREDGRIITVTDITQRKAAELALEAAKLRAEAAEAQAVSARQWLEDAIECTSEAVTIFDGEGRVVMHNRQFTALDARLERVAWHGLTFEQVVHDLYALGVLPPPDIDLGEAIRRRVEDFESGGRVTEFALASGRWLRSTERRMRSGGTVGLMVDITALKERESRLRTAMMQAQVANQAKSEFLANMSHELRTPLNAIIGFAEMMEHEVMGPVGNERYREYVQDIRSSGQHLLQVINNVLDLSRIEAGRITLHEDPVSPGALIESCLPLVRHRASEAGVMLEIELTPGLPILRADPTRLRQILLNLLSNAIKFTEAGGRVIVRAGRRPDGGLSFTVADSGIGMSPAELARAFEPFYQAEGRMTRRFEGTGLGLALAKALAEEHGGTLTLASTPGTGTRAVLTLPASRVIAPDPR